MNTLYNIPTKTPEQQASQRAAIAMRAPLAHQGAAIEIWKQHIKAIFVSCKNPATAPAQHVAAMGTSAAALFTWAENLRAYLEKENPGCTQIAEADLIKPYVKNDDGTVTLKS